MRALIEELWSDMAKSAPGAYFPRLSFLHVSETELTRGIAVLGDALRASVV